MEPIYDVKKITDEFLSHWQKELDDSDFSKLRSRIYESLDFGIMIFVIPFIENRFAFPEDKKQHLLREISQRVASLIIYGV